MFLNAIKKGDFKTAMNALHPGIIFSGADINAIDEQGYNAFYWAASCETLKDVKFAVNMLVKSGGLINASDKEGNTALQILMIEDKIGPDVLEVFIDNGANPNINLPVGGNLLHHFVYSEDFEKVNWLVENHIDINAKTMLFNNTALHIAASRKNSNIAEYLIISGKADINARNKAGHTPLDEAISKANLEVIKVLIKNGAEVIPEQRINLEKLGIVVPSQETQTPEVINVNNYEDLPKVLVADNVQEVFDN
jgi:ankyrin repeat protein